MHILLISEDETVCRQTRRVLDTKVKLSILSFEAIKTKELCYDIIIIDFNRERVAKRSFKIILDLICRIGKPKVPIFALCENSRISDQFEVLSMGALDLMERPMTDEAYKKKIEQLYNWKWYYDWVD